MRKLFYILIFFSSLFQYSFAQNADTTLNSISLRMGNAEDILVPVNLSIIDQNHPGLSLPPGEDRIDNSFSVGLMIVHPVNSKKSYRFKVDVTTLNISNKSDATDIHKIVAERKVSQTIIHINPGAQWGLTRNNFTIYGGLELSWNLYGKLSLDESKKESNAAGDTVFFQGSTSTSLKSGFSIGPGMFFGFSYKPFKHLAFGTEISDAMVYNYIGGETNVTDNQKPLNSASSSTTYTKNISYRGFGVTKPKGFLTLTYYFN